MIRPEVDFFLQWYRINSMLDMLTYIEDIDKAAKEACVLLSKLFLFFFVVVLVPLRLGSMMPYVEIGSSIINEVN